MKTNKAGLILNKYLMAVISLVFILMGCGGSEDVDDNGLNPAQSVKASIADMNGDGMPDILIEKVNPTDTRPWRFGLNSNSQFEANESLSQQFDPALIDDLVGTSGGTYLKAKAIGVADANNDGNNDVLVQLDGSDGRSYWKVFASHGSSSSNTISSDGALLSGTGGDDQRAVAFTDIDGDGYADILMQNQYGGYVHLFMYKGNGRFFDENPVSIYRFRTQLDNDFPEEIAGIFEILAVKDINNDGTADLVLDVKRSTYYRSWAEHVYDHCYLVRTFRDGAFEPQPVQSDCANYTGLIFAGVADVTGDGQSELILSDIGITWWSLPRTAFLMEGENGSKFQSSRDSRLNVWQKSSGGSMNISVLNDITGTHDRRHSYNVLALTDLNNDGLPDLLIETKYQKNPDYTDQDFGVVSYTDKQVKAIIANEDGTYEMQTWLTNLSNQDEILGIRDYNGDGLVDLLINSPLINLQRDYDGDGEVIETDVDEFIAFKSATLTKLYVLNNNGTSFESSGWPLWYEDADEVRVVGVEDSGLTTLANDSSALLGWVGTSNSPRYTQNEFKQFLVDKGLNLITTDQPLAANECRIAYPSAGNQDLSAGFGNLVCHVQTVDSVSIMTQSIYGGCDFSSTKITDDISRPGINCQIGTFEENLKIDLPGVPIDYNLGIKGPSAEACSTISVQYTCGKIGADLVSASAGYSLGDSRASAGAGIGLGAGGGAGYEDGVLSGSLDLKAGIGIQIEFAVDVNAAGATVKDAGEFTVKHGKEAFVYVGSEVYSAGAAVVDALTDSGEYVITGVGEGVEFIGETATAIGDGINDAANAIASFFGF